MGEILHGRAKSNDPVADNCGRCGGQLWVVTETSDGRMWWLCVSCGYRPKEINRARLHGPFPKIMQRFDPPPPA
jgi:hypothetical protein